MRKHVIRKTLTILSCVGLALSMFVLALSIGNSDGFWNFSDWRTQCYPSNGWITCIRNGPPPQVEPGSTFILQPKILWSVRLPLLAPIALFAILPLIDVIRCIRLGYRREHGLCQWCGYDLRASTGRCTECGLTKRSNDAGSQTAGPGPGGGRTTA